MQETPELELPRMPSPMPLWHPVMLLCTWFGAGKAKKLPGTAGTLAALPFAWVIHHSGGVLALAIFALATFVIGCIVSHIYCKRTATEDASEIVIDEVSGISFLLCSVSPNLLAYFVCFIVFRIFDMWKPWPISWFDARVKGGIGVMLDDFIAAGLPLLLIGIASSACYHAGLSFHPMQFWMGIGK
jgi:phosphatidylglycerophosphatase A